MTFVHRFPRKAFVLALGLGCMASDVPEGTPDPPSRFSAWAAWNALRGDAYELDAIPRRLENPKARVECNKEGLVEHRGTVVRYHGPVVVSPAFRERLER